MDSSSSSSSPQSGSSFLEILSDPFCRKVFGHGAGEEEDDTKEAEDWSRFTTRLTERLTILLRNPANHLSLFRVGYASLEAFLQSNVTGPPLDFDPHQIVFPAVYHSQAAELRRYLSATLTVQGQAVYPLAPHIELFWVAKTILSHDHLGDGFNGRRARMRIRFWHQKLLSEVNDQLRDQIYQDAGVLDGQLKSRLLYQGAAGQHHYAEFLIERAVIDTYYGHDVDARKQLVAASKVQRFHFALTGVLGRRTKFQQDDISQLVVLAMSEDRTDDYSAGTVDESGSVTRSRSAINGHEPLRRVSEVETATSQTRAESSRDTPSVAPPKKPESIPLRDDTLLESIHFTTPQALPEVVSDGRELLPELAELDPSSQPLLHPLDSTILLQIASSISNTSPSDGLTREETMPYATRVLEGGSSNWQVYTQALLVRSRIEGYRSRTAERGLLQLQALVDQVIIDTTPNKTADQAPAGAGTASALEVESSQASPIAEPTTFLPAARPSETASASERLKHIHQLHPSFRWELEAELAARWVGMGGLKTALEIYTRLEMHAEVALCLAATDSEAKAIQLTRKLLFKSPLSGETEDEQLEDGRAENSYIPEGSEEELDELPTDAPRLFCILGDLENRPSHYERAWTASKARYARAQRSLGRHHARQNKNFAAAAEAYRKSLAANRLDTATWFALGCVYLELEDFVAAVDSFTRTVQLEAEDAEAWSNLAAALIRLPEESEALAEKEAVQDDETSTEMGEQVEQEPQHKSNDDNIQGTGTNISHRQQALHALRHATRLKQSDARIWDNYLTIAASLLKTRKKSSGTARSTTAPWTEVIHALSRIIDLRSPTLGEKSIDEPILTEVVRHVTTAYTYQPNPITKTTDTSDAKQTRIDGVTSEDPNRDQNQQEPEQKGPHRPGTLLPTQVQTLMTERIKPLVTSSPRLWILVAEMEEWRADPDAALQAWEKAWRAALAAMTQMANGNDNTVGRRSQTGKRSGGGSSTTKRRASGKHANNNDSNDNNKNGEKIPDKHEQSWNLLVATTLRLVSAYRINSEDRDRDRDQAGAVGKGNGSSWKFKARNAIRRVLALRSHASVDAATSTGTTDHGDENDNGNADDNDDEENSLIELRKVLDEI